MCKTNLVFPWRNNKIKPMGQNDTKIFVMLPGTSRGSQAKLGTGGTRSAAGLSVPAGRRRRQTVGRPSRQHSAPAPPGGGGGNYDRLRPGSHTAFLEGVGAWCVKACDVWYLAPDLFLRLLFFYPGDRRDRTPFHTSIGGFRAALGDPHAAPRCVGI